jgi:hypothetical protein
MRQSFLASLGFPGFAIINLTRSSILISPACGSIHFCYARWKSVIDAGISPRFPSTDNFEPLFARRNHPEALKTEPEHCILGPSLPSMPVRLLAVLDEMVRARAGFLTDLIKTCIPAPG